MQRQCRVEFVAVVIIAECVPQINAKKELGYTCFRLGAVYTEIYCKLGLDYSVFEYFLFFLAL